MKTTEFTKRAGESYDDHARRVMAGIGLGVSIRRDPLTKCPPWRGKVCDHVHGWNYLVALTSGGKSITFEYWDSLANKTAGKSPTVYDVLSCVSSDANMPSDPDEVVEEFGDMKPSQAIAIAAWALKLRAFFNASELDALAEIQ